jgi:tetratricopeptide (TPR) repeat protein
VLGYSADVLTTQSNLDLALNYYTQAKDVLRRLAGPEHYRVARVLHRIGGIFLLQGRHDEAMNYFLLSLGIYQQCYGTETNRDVAETIKSIGDAYKMMQKYKDASKQYGKALAIWKLMARGRKNADEIAYLYQGEMFLHTIFLPFSFNLVSVYFY